MVEKRFKVLLLYIIFIMIIIISPSAYASDYKLNSHISATSGGTKNRYGGLENYNYGSYGTYTFGTRYQGRLGNIETYIDYPFEANTTYTLTYNMNTEDFINHFGSSYWWDCSQAMTNGNATVQSINYISYKKIKFTFTPTANTTCIFVSVRSTNPNSTAITQITNWQLDSIYLYDPDYQGSGGSGGSGGTSTPTPDPNQQIIDNANQNTTDIIDNANENNEKLVDAIENQNKNCKVNMIDFTDYYKSNNTISFNYKDNRLDLKKTGTGTAYITWKIKNIEPNTTYTISHGKYTTNDTGSIFRVRVATGSGDWLTPQFDITDNNTFTFNSGNNSTAVLYYYFLSNVNTDTTIYDLKIYNPDYCVDTQQQQVDAINDVNNSINNDNVDSGVGSDFFNDFTSTDNGGISAIVTKPLMIINNLLSNNGQCTNLTLPEFLGVSTAYLPSGCILWDNATPTMINLWNIFVCGFGSYFILKDIFRIIENLKNPDNDKVEVMDL